MKTPTSKLRDKLQAIIYEHTLNVCSKEEVDLSAKKIYKGTIEAILSALRECVLAKKIDKKSVMHQLDIESHIRGYNLGVQDIANLFGAKE